MSAVQTIQVEWDFEKVADGIIIPLLEQHGYWQFGHPEVVLPKLHQETSPFVVIRRFGSEPYVSITIVAPETFDRDSRSGGPLSFRVKRCLAEARGFGVRYSLLTDGDRGLLFLNGSEYLLKDGAFAAFVEDIDRRVVAQDRFSSLPCDVEKGRQGWRDTVVAAPKHDPFVLWNYLCEFTTFLTDNRDRVGSQLAEFYRHRDNPFLPEYDLVNPARRLFQRLTDTFGLSWDVVYNMDNEALREAMEAIYVWPRGYLFREELETAYREMGGIATENAPEDTGLPDDWLARTFEVTPEQAPALCQRLVIAYQDYNERVLAEAEEAVAASYDEAGRGDLFKAAEVRAVRPEPVEGFRRWILAEQVKICTDRPEALRAARMLCILRMTARMRAFTD